MIQTEDYSTTGGGRWRFVPAVLRLLILAALALAAGNLLFEQNLPGAVYIQHAVFTVVVTVFLWLTEENWILPVVAGALTLGGIGLFFLRRRAVWPWRLLVGVLSLAVLAGQAGFVFFGCLMEKELTVAILAGVVLLLVWRRFDQPPTPPDALTRGQRLLIAAFAAGSLYYIYSILDTDPSGYHLLQWAKEFLGGHTAGAASLEPLFYFAMTLGAIAALVLFLRRPPLKRRLPPLLIALAIMAAVLLFYRGVLERDIKLAGEMLIGFICLTVADGFLKWGLPLLPNVTFDARGYPKKMVYLCFIALLCMTHAYTFRVFACPENPALSRLGDAPEVFRAVLTDDGRYLFLVYRTRNQLVRIDLEGGSMPQPVDPGVLRDLSQPNADRFWGTPEDLIYLPERGLLAATFHPYPDLYDSLAAGGDKKFEDIVILIDPEQNAVVKVFPLTDICWINSIRYNARRDFLYVGCEDQQRLLALDLDDGRLLRDQPTPAVGDIQDLEIDDRFDPQRLYIVSLWYNANASEVDDKTWQPLRQRFVGGANYETAFSPADDLLFIGRFYESRVTALDTRSLRPVGILRTGLGTRAVQVDRRRNLLLVSSIYDGSLRVFDTTDLSLKTRLTVGGHVKSIALDEKRGLAYFGSQCGLFRLDLNRLAKP